MAAKRVRHFQDSWIVEFKDGGIDRSELGDTFVRCKLCKADSSVSRIVAGHTLLPTCEPGAILEIATSNRDK